ncbi:UDP-N-acetylglucosamine 1-carboxyvinyltransferase [Actinosynnema pretiosum subsp. pretiosum]|uniref:UDP-N-acetylglucosamine 1-carboxyvinyltransferase n=2 Tax=Actinosynnema TaxID=40566 RepID=C6WEA1_ACTMD|nr:UDP-N-acetylglucosamine 1-carboxyvinyltransferase [Actinosynnema mirum]ACU35844.1 transcriptional regulator, XRE family [Actinosynnema mirum DSM 43827]AXX29269.1 UDP-N-acetylglucosamine 1-carboxyvinyltransferase [Actinosynnema pretiosum subsp. pretiosum]QUF06472.1 UDP-N-acetylglucosamine 1-carboxyvinyltransferase [Actinosynnema pretiosum subsp. pretiosum]
MTKDLDRDYLTRVGGLIRASRRQRGWSQAQLATAVSTSQSAINRIEQGGQNLSLEMLSRISEALDSGIVSIGQPAPTHLRVTGGRRLSGTISVKTSKNAGVALLCASLLNSGRTVLRKLARIEEVNRILEVLGSIGVRTRWLNDDNDLEIIPPKRLDLAGINVDAARRTRSIIMLLGPLLHHEERFELPYAGGCALGSRTVEPHMVALRPFGLEVKAAAGSYHAEVDRTAPKRPIVLTERGDTVTENALMAAARHEGTTVIRNASPNYMVQDLCFFLTELGVRIEGVGTTTLTVHGVGAVDQDIDYAPSEDPIEAMSLISAAIVTSSEITIQRVPIEFLEIELALLEEMGLDYDRTDEYPAANGRTRLVDLVVRPSALHAPIDKIHPMPFPGLNIDNLPFFALIAAVAQGSTLIHDWVYENRALYLTELTKLGAKVTLMDPHRVYVEGPTHWSGAEVICPPALRPAVVVLLAMLAAKGTSVLRNVYVINRGYEQLAERLNQLGAEISTFRDI